MAKAERRRKRRTLVVVLLALVGAAAAAKPLMDRLRGGSEESFDSFSTEGSPNGPDAGAGGDATRPAGAPTPSQ
jgi:hypothetical protein